MLEADAVEQGVRDLLGERLVALQPERKEPREIGAGLVERVLGRPALRVPAHLLQRDVDELVQRLVLGEGGEQRKPALAVHGKPGRHAVGKAAIDADGVDEERSESAAEGGIRHHRLEEAGRAPWNAGRHDAQLRLRRVGFVQDQGPQSGLPGKLKEIERRRTRLACPSNLREPLAGDIEQTRRGRIPHHREQRAARTEARGVEGETILAAEGLHFAAVSMDGMTVRVRRPVAETDGGARRYRRRLVEIALQCGEGAPSRRGDLLLRVGGLERDLEERIERPLGEIGWHGQRKGRLVHRHVDEEARAHALDQLVDAVGIAPLGPAPEQIGGELREPGLGPRILARSRRHRKTAMEERHAPALHGQQDESGRLLHDGVGRKCDIAQRLHAATASAGSSPGRSVARLRR